MELLQELFVTAVFAVVCSFLIAKLVSMAMAGADSSHDSQFSKSQNVDQKITRDDDDLQYFEKLKVEGFKSEKRVKFTDEVAEMVDEFVDEPVDVEKSVNRDEPIETECRELRPKSIKGSLKEEEELENVLGKREAEFEENKQVGVKLAADKSFTEKSEEVIEEKQKGEIESIGIEFAAEHDVVEESEEIRIVDSEAKEKAEEKKIEIESDEDDWEGIERSELEQIFAKAAKFVESGDKDEGLTSVGSDVQMELYGLHKVATEGPCREQPPMALKVAARAKWNAWQRLGNMNPEVAMEQYVALVSDKVPGWMEDKSTDNGKPGSTEAANHGALPSDLSTSSSHHPYITEERNPEVAPGTEKNDLTGGLILENRATE
uniref:Acyl-CoA binding protein 3B n=1 Tax=Vernicia fordii TaxID=73154 RepID=K9ZUG8_VERFO|nr:acyl-CoA binding protein 3B [Vernicia fordii]AFZ62130.1 acyl-CoA binding protein 3B [Vernicia fordii]